MFPNAFTVSAETGLVAPAMALELYRSFRQGAQELQFSWQAEPAKCSIFVLDIERRQGLCVDKDGRTIAVSGEICVCIYIYKFHKQHPECL